MKRIVNPTIEKVRDLVLNLKRKGRPFKEIVKKVKEECPGYPIDKNEVQRIINEYEI